LCTPYHKFYIQKDYRNTKPTEVRAEDLKEGMKIIKCNFPMVPDNDCEFTDAYTHGLFCANGTYDENLVEDNKEITIYLSQDFQEKYFVPYNYSVNSKLRWLEGYLDGDGCVCIEKTYQTIQCVSTEISFMKDVKTLLNTLGCNPTIDCKETYKLYISACDTQNLIQIGFKPKRLVVNHKEVELSTSKFITVKKIDKNFTKQDTYCFNEPKKHCGVFNGIITGQCAEIMQHSDDKNPSVCNLASINLKSIIKNPPNVLSNVTIISKSNCFYCKLLKYFLSSRGIHYTEFDKENTNNDDKIQKLQQEYGDINYKTVPQIFATSHKESSFNFIGGFWDTWEYLRPIIDYNQLKDISEDLTYNLNKVIDRNFYPIEGAKNTNFKHRPIGVGVQGLADMFAEMLVPFDSDLAKQINKQVFETIYFGCMKASIDLAEKDGPYSSFEGSPLSKGQFQFNLWGLQDENLSGLWNWGDLRTKVLKHGARNSLLTALMPTASTAQILGNNECFEPFTSNIYTRSTIAGEFTMVNGILIKILENTGIWNKDFENKIIYHRGSVQNIKELPTAFKDVFKTVWEVSQKKYIELSAERGPFICQSQSLNIWFSTPTFGSLYKAHMLGWSLGLKTGSYYVRQLPASNSQRLGMSASTEKTIEDNLTCESCSA
jgi:ribonucleotide reductase alpha subunit